MAHYTRFAGHGSSPVATKLLPGGPKSAGSGHDSARSFEPAAILPVGTWVTHSATCVDRFQKGEGLRVALPTGGASIFWLRCVATSNLGMDTVRSVRRRLGHIVSNALAAEAPIANFSGPTLVLSRAVNTRHGMVHGARSCDHRDDAQSQFERPFLARVQPACVTSQVQDDAPDFASNSTNLAK